MNFLGSSFYINKTNINKVVAKSTSAPLFAHNSSCSLETIYENDSFVSDKKTNFLEKIKNTFNRLFSSCSLKKDSNKTTSNLETQQQSNNSSQNTNTKFPDIMVPGIYFVDGADFDDNSCSPINYQFSEHSSSSYINFDLLTNSSSMTTTPLSEFRPSSYDFVKESYKARHGK